MGWSDIPEEHVDEIAGILDRARERMNTSGLHWVKGHYRKKVRKPKHGDVTCWCSAGAIYAETKPGKVRDMALIELARRVDPVRMAHIEQMLSSSYPSYFGRRGKQSRRSRLGDHALRVITEWNDAKHRRWRDVDRKFRRTVGELARGRAQEVGR